MLVQTKNKWDAAKAFLNIMLEDETMYCGNCDADWDPNCFPCCENPQVGRHKDHIRAIAKQNKERRELANNEYGSTENKALRWGVSIPPRIFNIWNGYFKLYNEKLINDNQELHEFMRAFKCFTVPERI